MYGESMLIGKIKERSIEKKINLNKLFLTSLLSLFILALSVSFISGTPNLNADNVTLCAPEVGCGLTLTGSVNINASFDSLYLDQNWSSGNLYIQSVGLTDNSTLYRITSTLSATNTSNNITLAIDSTVLQDGTDYTLTFNLFNGSNYVNKTTTVTVSNGVPTATLGNSMIHDGYSISGTDTFTTQINSDYDIGISNCTIIAEDSNTLAVTTSTMTATNNACTNTTNSISSLALTAGNCYNIYIQAEDAQASKTNSTNRLLCTSLVGAKKGTGTAIEQLTQPQARTGVSKVSLSINSLARTIKDNIRSLITYIQSLFNK